MPRDYKKLAVFKISYSFVLEVYRIAGTLPNYETMNLGDQLRRASTSVVLNICEGCGSSSDRVFFRYLERSYMSAKELSVILMLCKDLNYLSSKDFLRLDNDLEKLKILLYSFMSIFKKKIGKYKNNYFNVLKEEIEKE